MLFKSPAVYGSFLSFKNINMLCKTLGGKNCTGELREKKFYCALNVELFHLLLFAL